MRAHSGYQYSQRTSAIDQHCKEIVKNTRRKTAAKIAELVALTVCLNLCDRIFGRQSRRYSITITGVKLLFKLSIPVPPQPAYSSELTPCDFFLLSRMKNLLKGNYSEVPKKCLRRRHWKK
ncbi:hypothetical protein AVEN_224835-1 [Araneus ventricosus]|uniref:Uncharacterized protein n=1 Tax=Araneus ventricosus TaxID=182803 RepID=A0A4Y2N7T2_ARAVE|nr:hypothetical protein AVEN_224835-1 [Araneus ventricosus]